MQGNTGQFVPISVGDITIFIEIFSLEENKVYKDSSNNLYIKLPAAHGNKYIKLINGTWESVELTQAQISIIESELILSDYSIAYGEFIGGSMQDIKLSSVNGHEILLEGTSGGFKKARRTIFIHTDLLGSPVAETDENGRTL